MQATMGSNGASCSFLSFLIVVGFHLHLASSSHISNQVLEPHGPLTRSLLQQKINCNVDFEHMNYTVITNQCKGPNYTPERCCPPLKQLLCPVKDEVNDLRSNCADTFFSYVNLYGKYPPGLFASLCREDKQGLSCEGVQPAPGAQPGTGGAVGRHAPWLLMLFAGLPCLDLFL